jgi:hypothetical protein
MSSPIAEQVFNIKTVQRHLKHLFTKKAFREHLNTMCPFNRAENNTHGQNPGPKKRAYGDYLYAQDREQFDVEYMKWVAKALKPKGR